MEPPIIKDPNTTNLEFPLNSNSHISPTFLLHNGFNNPSSPQISDIEMIAVQPVTYTSLKDLLPASPPTIMSPTHNSSWHQIPIKNPLVKQAALSYLQPMSTPTEVGDKGLFWRLREWCCGECGCIGWVNDIVSRAFREVFWEGTEEEIDDEEEDYETVD